MKHLKICITALFSLMLLPSAHAAALQPGKVQALIVVGDVSVIDSANNRKPLSKGDTIQEGALIVAGKSSGATLVFSNGATMRVKENGQMKIDRFEQASFDEAKEGSFIRLSRDPSQSVTDLDLRNGTLQGEVKQLNTAAGSKFTVKTPAGSAGIRGTIVSITVERDANGNVTAISATCATGNIAFTPAPGATAVATSGGGTTTNITNQNVDVGTGATVQITMTVGANGQPTGVTVTGAGATSAAVQQQVTQLFDAINVIRAGAGLPPIPPPTVTATDNVSTGGGAVTPTVTANIDANTGYSGNILPPSPPQNQNAPGNGTGGSGGGSGGTGTGASTGTGTPTNPTVPVSPQGSSDSGSGSGTGSPNP